MLRNLNLLVGPSIKTMMIDFDGFLCQPVLAICPSDGSNARLVDAMMNTVSDELKTA